MDAAPVTPALAVRPVNIGLIFGEKRKTDHGCQPGIQGATAIAQKQGLQAYFIGNCRLQCKQHVKHIVVFQLRDQFETVVAQETVSVVAQGTGWKIAQGLPRLVPCDFVFLQ